MAEAKICGLTDEAGLSAALAAAARYIGLVFFANSPRNIGFNAASNLAARARGRSEIVAVTVDADDELLTQIAARVRPDWIQAHGREPPERLAHIRQFAVRGLIKALPIARGEDFAQSDSFAPVADMFLFDAKVPAALGRPGGAGQAFDWTLLSGRRFSRPWFLSGGLSPENVASAIAQSGADLVDVSSGIERAPGLKDPERIAAFCAALRLGSRAPEPFRQFD